MIYHGINSMAQYLHYKGKKYPVPIQYSLPKGINSVEAGLLIDGSIEDEDLLSIFYDWDKKGIVKIVKQENKLRIEANKGLPDDAKEYEKYIYDNFFSNGKFNLLEARLLVMDYCFQKGWIQDYIPTVKDINNGRTGLALGLFILLPILGVVVIIISFITFIIDILTGTASYNNGIELHFGGDAGGLIIILYLFIKFLITSRLALQISINKLKKLHVYNTISGNKFVAELLGYKKYLDQIKHNSKSDDIKDDIMMQYGIADHNVVLKTEISPYTIEMLKNCAYNDMIFLSMYLEKHKS